MATAEEGSKSKLSRFHNFHGTNIILCEDNTVAYRKSSFANALTFSERPLSPGELFLLEIEKNEAGWSGNMRLGLTNTSPHILASTNSCLPMYALPDFTNLGSSWIYPVTTMRDQSHSSTTAIEGSSLIDEHERLGTSSGNSSEVVNILGDGMNIKTSRGLIPRSVLRTANDIHPMDTGSRIGIIFVPTAKDKTKAQMHFIINGYDQGPSTKDIPYTDSPLHAVVDVYGTTKQVRIIQLYDLTTLQSSCRDVILTRIKNKTSIIFLPLPQRLKDYLNSYFT